MDQSRQVSSYGPVKPSYEQDRLNRINANPYDSPVGSRDRAPGTTSRNFLNYVKGRMYGTVSSLKKLLHDPKPIPWVTLSSNEPSQLPSFSEASMRDLSTSIQGIVSKPEYQRNYDVSLNMSDSQKKTSFLGVVDVYKDMAAEKIRERMKEKQTSVLPPAVSCSNRPVPVYGQNADAEDGLVEITEYRNRDIKKKASNQGEKSDVNKKRGFHSILSVKEKKDRANKKVTFCPKLERVNKHSFDLLKFPKQSSGIIRYTSSDEEDDPVFNRRIPQKQVFAEDKIIRNDPVIKLCLVQSKRSRVNPFQKKYLSDKSMMSQSTLSEKAIKKMSNDDYYKSYAGKLNNENSFASDNFINDSKLETDSDESNLIHNVLDSPNLNILKDIKYRKTSRDEVLDDLSEDLEKHPRSLSDTSSKKPYEINGLESPRVQESPVESKQIIIDEEEEEKVNPQEIKKSGENSSALSGIQSFLFSKSIPKKETENISPEPKPLLSLFNTQKQEIAEPVAKPSSPIKPSLSLFSNLSKQSTNITEFNLQKELSSASKDAELIEKPEVQETVIPIIQPTIKNEVQPIVEAPVILDKKEDVPVVQDTTSKPFLPTPTLTLTQMNEEARKNPIFAAMNFEKQEPVQTNNPFLRSASSNMNITDILGGNASSNTTFVNQQDTQSIVAPVQSVEQTAPVETKPKGILELLGSSSQSDAQKPSLFRAESLSLKPAAASLSWMNGSNETQENKQTNLFGGLSTLAPQPSLFSAPSQSQGNPFVSSLGQNTISQSGMGMNFENNNSGLGNSVFGSNNNTNSMFGSNIGFGGGNDGMNMMGAGNGLFQQNTGNELTFGGNAYNNNSSGLLGLGGMNASTNNVTANPFASQSMFGSGAGNNFGATQSSGLLSMGGGSSGSMFGGDSAKKKRGQKDRAF